MCYKAVYPGAWIIVMRKVFEDKELVQSRNWYNLQGRLLFVMVVNLIQERAWFEGGNIDILNQGLKIENYILLFSNVLVKLIF